MKFTRYFSGILKQHGTPDINADYYAQILNIIVVENQMDLLAKLQRKERHSERKSYLNREMFDLKCKLDKLTMENRPENLLKYMINKSKLDY